MTSFTLTPHPKQLVARTILTYDVSKLSKLLRTIFFFLSGVLEWYAPIKLNFLPSFETKAFEPRRFNINSSNQPSTLTDLQYTITFGASTPYITKPSNNQFKHVMSFLATFTILRRIFLRSGDAETTFTNFDKPVEDNSNSE